MNFELADKLADLLKENKLETAIETAESELRKIPNTEFHKVLDRDLLDLTKELSEFLYAFYVSANEFYNKKKKGLFKRKASSDDSKKLKSIYSEMNGFTINYDLWFINLFAYNINNDLDDLDWLADYDYVFEYAMTIIGFEDLQDVFKNFMESEEKTQNQKDAFDICELIIVLRLQQLFKNAYEENSDRTDSWSQIPILVTAHDYEMIYKTR